MVLTCMFKLAAYELGMHSHLRLRSADMFSVLAYCVDRVADLNSPLTCFLLSSDRGQPSCGPHIITSSMHIYRLTWAFCTAQATAERSIGSVAVLYTLQNVCAVVSHRHRRHRSPHAAHSAYARRGSC